MTYSTSNPPKLLVGSFSNVSGESSIWNYSSTNTAADINTDGFFTNGKSLGMKVGDVVQCTDTDASPVTITVHRVVAVNANGSIDVDNGDTEITGTDSD